MKPVKQTNSPQRSVFIKKHYVVASLLYISFVLTPFSLSVAQTETQNFLNDILTEQKNTYFKKTITETIKPEYPGPNENTEISFTSTLIDLNRAEISWYIDNTLYVKEIGRKKINITTKDIGDTSEIRIKIRSIEGDVVEKRINITPMEMDLLWEANTYTPPFYKGKALLSPNSILKVTALPNLQSKTGKSIDPATLVYIWKGKGRKNFQEFSGFGKSTLYTGGSQPFGDNFIKVEISSLDNSIKIGGEITIKLSKPKIIFYEDNPLQGIKYESAISKDFELLEQELAIKAEPYFFAKDDKESGNLIYEWKQSGKNIINEASGRIIFRRGEESGATRINLAVKNIAKTFQTATQSFILNFTSAGFF